MSTSTSSFGFSYDEDVSAIAHSFETGYVVDKGTAIVSRSRDRAIVDLRLKFVNFNGSSGDSYGESYDIDSELTFELGVDRVGDIRIQHISEIVPTANGLESRPSFGLIKLVNSNLYEETTEDVIETRLADKRTGKTLLRTKTTQSWSSKNPVMKNSFMMLDSGGNAVVGVH